MWQGTGGPTLPSKLVYLGDLHVRFCPTILTVQSTYCKNVQEHCEIVRRTVHVVNLGKSFCCHGIQIGTILSPSRCGDQVLQQIYLHADPAADDFTYPVSFDIRDLVPLEDVMEELQLGPNGWALFDIQIEKAGLWRMILTVCLSVSASISMQVPSLQGIAVLHGISGGQP